MGSSVLKNPAGFARPILSKSKIKYMNINFEVFAIGQKVESFDKDGYFITNGCGHIAKHIGGGHALIRGFDGVLRSTVSLRVATVEAIQSIEDLRREFLTDPNCRPGLWIADVYGLTMEEKMAFANDPELIAANAKAVRETFSKSIA